MTQERLIERLRKVLALTTSPVEGEAQAAAEMLRKLLTEHNLSMADLEERGQVVAPGVQGQDHDLGKAAFRWKLNLAEAIADHYFCIGMVNRTTKQVTFVGRPDNVESLRMLYDWLIDQVRRISSEERVKHKLETGEHVDPLRWQLAFGLGAVNRLAYRLRVLKDKQVDPSTTALVLHHASENSDYLEEKYGYRVDGRMTRKQERWDKEWKEREAAREALKATDLEAYYNAYPWERPLTDEQLAAIDKQEAERQKREERNARRRKGRGPKFMSADEWRKYEQDATARAKGRKAADNVNLEPFLTGRDPVKGEIED